MDETTQAAEAIVSRSFTAGFASGKKQTYNAGTMKYFRNFGRMWLQNAVQVIGYGSAAKVRKIWISVERIYFDNTGANFGKEIIGE